MDITDENVSPLFLLGLLNSLPLRAYWVDRFWDRRRTFPKIKGTYLKALPLPARGDPQVEQLADALQRDTAALTDEERDARRTQLQQAIDANQDALDQRVASLFSVKLAHVEGLREVVELSRQAQYSTLPGSCARSEESRQRGLLPGSDCTLRPVGGSRLVGWGSTSLAPTRAWT